MTDEAKSLTGSPGQATTSTAWDEAFLKELRAQMVKFAHLQLRDRHAAEDAVQEALTAATLNASSFAGRSAFKTWVFGILKNKLADELRRRSRLGEVSQLQRESEDKEVRDLFDERGYWQVHERPRHWSNPEEAFSRGEFWRVFEACLDHLPARQARVFMMREFLDLQTDEICASLGLSVSNVHVLLHRARLRLRKCLESRWFAGEERC